MQIVRRRHEPIDDILDDVVFYDLVIRRDVAFLLAVEINPTDIEWVFLQASRNIVDDVLDRVHALWSTEAPECRIRHRIRLATMRHDPNVLEVIGIIAVEHGAIVDRSGEVR